ncbi:MAG: ABC transporter permease [Bacillota bacterium]
MRTYIIRRIVMLVPVFIGISILTFLMLHLTPGSPVDVLLPDYASAEAAEHLIRQLGLDRPLHEQYFMFVAKVLQLDFGRSVRTNRPVTIEIFSRWPATIELAVAGMIIAISIGIPLGIISAVYQYSPADYGSMFMALIWVCMPSFFLAVVLQLVFGMHLGWFPVFGRAGPWYTSAGLRSLVMPAFTVGSGAAAILARLSRSSMLEVLRQDYIRTARAKGLAERVVIYRHALKNALIPTTTIMGLQMGAILGGAFIAETVYARPGVGRLAVTAIFQRDFPVIQAVVLLVASIYVLVNLVVDIVYTFLDPRIRYD